MSTRLIVSTQRTKIINFISTPCQSRCLTPRSWQCRIVTLPTFLLFIDTDMQQIPTPGRYLAVLIYSKYSIIIILSRTLVDIAWRLHCLAVRAKKRRKTRTLGG